MPRLEEDRLFPTDEDSRCLARELYKSVQGLPIVGPHWRFHYLCDTRSGRSDDHG